MNSEKSVKQQLVRLEKRVARIELLISPVVKSKKQTTKTMTLAKHILVLRESSFFSQIRTAEEVHEKLSGSYSCVLNRVEVALVRLASRKQLRKASKIVGTKSYKAYVW